MLWRFKRQANKGSIEATGQKHWTEVAASLQMVLGHREEERQTLEGTQAKQSKHEVSVEALKKDLEDTVHRWVRRVFENVVFWWNKRSPRWRQQRSHRRQHARLKVRSGFRCWSGWLRYGRPRKTRWPRHWSHCSQFSFDRQNNSSNSVPLDQWRRQLWNLPKIQTPEVNEVLQQLLKSLHS